jgi:hypothetical protein
MTIISLLLVLFLFVGGIAFLVAAVLGGGGVILGILYAAGAVAMFIGLQYVIFRKFAGKLMAETEVQEPRQPPDPFNVDDY